MFRNLSLYAITFQVLQRIYNCVYICQVANGHAEEHGLKRSDYWNNALCLICHPLLFRRFYNNALCLVSLVCVFWIVRSGYVDFSVGIHQI